MKLRKQIGRYKTWLNRLQTYLSPLNFVMVLYLYIITEPLDITWEIWSVILFSILVSVLIFDIIIVFPSEQDYTTKKNPEWLEMREDVKDIKRILLNNNKEKLR